MPLLDHFHEPLDPRADWESFHHRWAVTMADALDRTLPRRFYARVEFHLGSEVVTDVAEFEPASDSVGANGPQGGVAVQTYAPPATTLVLPGRFPDEAEVQIRTDPGDRLLAAIELVSPSNKHSPTARRAFAAKSAAYLQAGVGLVIVDPVTERHFNLHNELVDLMGLGPDFLMAGDPAIYVAAYRPAHRDKEDWIDTWLHALEVGRNLPEVPFFLRGFGCIPLDLEASYTETRQRSRLS